MTGPDAGPPPPEFSRLIDLRQLTDGPLTVAATPAECSDLARRFGLVAVERLEAELLLVPEGSVVTATGRMRAAWVQPCAISGEDLAQRTDEEIRFRFVPARAVAAPDEEIELTDDALDDIDYTGTAFDVGEAVAQSLALAIDPFASGPDADAARKAAGILTESAGGAFAALAALKLNKD